MMKFKEINGQLFEMIEKPIPLTVDAEMPCLVRLIQDDSPMGRYNRDTWLTSQLQKIKICNNLIDYCVNELEDNEFYHFEIIGIPVPEGSAKWAWYQMQCGKKVSRPAETYVKDWWYAMDIQNIAKLHGIPGISCERNYGGWINLMANTGWKLYEPEPAKTPIVDCNNCIKKCGKRNDSIDHCVDYESEPAFKVGDWVTDDVVQGRMVTRAADTTWVEDQDGKQYHIETPRLRKLDPSEVKVTITLSGTVHPDADNHDYAWIELDNGASVCLNIKSEIRNPAEAERVESLLRAQEGK